VRSAQEWSSGPPGRRDSYCLIPAARPHRRIVHKGAFNRPMRKWIPKLNRGQSA
jgi:hypothetical protein